MVKYIETQKTQVITKNGECEININLTLNINLTNEGLSLNVNNKEGMIVNQVNSQKNDKVEWEIPDFTNTLNPVNFGK